MGTTKQSGYGTLLANRQYRKYIIATVIGRFGDSIDSIAYGWMVYALTGSRAWLSVVFGVNALPTILLQPFAGVWVERMDKKKVVVLCDIGRGAIVALTGALFALGWLQPWHLLVLTFLNSTLEAFRGPAGTSLLPRILQRDQFDHAMGLSGTLSRIAEMVGLGAAGALVGLLGIGGTLIVDAATFILSAVLLMFTRLKPQAQQEEAMQQSFWKSAKDGLACLTGNKVILWMCIIGCVINPLLIPLNTLMTAFVQENLQLGVEALSTFSVVLSLMMGIGALAYPLVRKKLSFAHIIRYGVATIGIAYALLVLAPLPSGGFMRLAVLIGASALVGIAASQVSTATSAMFIKTVPESHLGRVSALFNAMAMGITPLASFAVAGVVTVVPINWLYGIMGIITFAIAFALWLNKVTRHLGEEQTDATTATQTDLLCG